MIVPTWKPPIFPEQPFSPHSATRALSLDDRYPRQGLFLSYMTTFLPFSSSTMCMSCFAFLDRANFSLFCANLSTSPRYKAYLIRHPSTNHPTSEMQMPQLLGPFWHQNT
ncbi:hypothetical protein Fmac_025692 [Flemingia macrophylla]|uniref:Uncharacterized protein n=1 Tax=Flemingia macrophylla TaxID=520843 RepID=A0ABD1LSX9_9FABA